MRLAANDVSLRAALEGLRFVFRVAADPLDDAARFLRDVLLVGDGAAADLRAGHPARRRARLRLAVRGAGSGRGRDKRRRWCRCRRIERRGQTLLWAVGGYGLATVVFGLSRSFWVTFVCLALTGATDTVSMVIRNIIRQLETPDRLRGRMTGVNMVFFQGGPQLGELEAGAVANWVGAPILGGVAAESDACCVLRGSAPRRPNYGTK